MLIASVTREREAKISKRSSVRIIIVMWSRNARLAGNLLIAPRSHGNLHMALSISVFGPDQLLL
jgi:uncharacterized membrane protein